MGNMAFVELLFADDGDRSTQLVFRHFSDAIAGDDYFLHRYRHWIRCKTGRYGQSECSCCKQYTFHFCGPPRPLMERSYPVSGRLNVSVPEWVRFAHATTPEGSVPQTPTAPSRGDLRGRSPGFATLHPAAFPINRSVAFCGRCIVAYSCGGSASFSPASLDQRNARKMRTWARHGQLSERGERQNAVCSRGRRICGGLFP